ncbi:hypothetical protein ACPM5D_005522 [Escherichia coli]
MTWIAEQMRIYLRGWKSYYNLNFSNRPVRTRMPGGVAGAQPCAAPYADQVFKAVAVGSRWQFAGLHCRTYHPAQSAM